MSRLPYLTSCFWMGISLLLMISVAEQSEIKTRTDSGRVDTDVKVHGVDDSWPMQHDIGNQQYENFMDGCYKQGYANYEKRADGLYQRKGTGEVESKGMDKQFYIACNHAEQDRLDMNLNQPKDMQNYTHAGYAKVNTPTRVVHLLRTFWEKNKRFIWPEFWNPGNTFVNSWKAPTSLLDIGRQDVPHPLSTEEYNTLIQSIKEVLESWTNQKLILTSAYGIRTYSEGAILAPHVDRLPLVSSAIINVFQQNLSEPWVLEVIGHDGIAHNLTSEPTEMILYESASIIHGRPYPLSGEGATYGSLFVHFEPLYHTLRHAQSTGDHYSGTAMKDRNQNSKVAFEKALEQELSKPTLKELHGKAQSGMIDKDRKTAPKDRNPEATAFRKTPDYVWPEYDALYDQRFYFEYNKDLYPKSYKSVFGNLNSHQAASAGELNRLKEIAKNQGRSQLFKADHNGWKPLHEAARSGHADVLEYLLKEGAKVNERTNFNEGGNALYWAQKDPKKNARAIAVLEKYGGVSVAPFAKNADKSKKDTTIENADKSKKDTTIENADKSKEDTTIENARATEK